jgi:hypothetical protein
MSATAATYVFIVFVLQFVYGILRLVVPVAFETGATGMHSWESAMLVNTLVQAVISLALAALLVWLSIEKFERLRRA